MRPKTPARSEKKTCEETIRTLRAENRRLRKQLKEAKKSPPDLEEQENEGGPTDLKIDLTKPLCPNCGSGGHLEQIDFFSHILSVCGMCNYRKTKKKW